MGSSPGRTTVPPLWGYTMLSGKPVVARTLTPSPVPRRCARSGPHAERGLVPLR